MKNHFIQFLTDFIASADVKLPPVSISSRWNSWFEAASYHATRIHLYEGFFKAKKHREWQLKKSLSL